MNTISLHIQKSGDPWGPMPLVIYTEDFLKELTTMYRLCKGHYHCKLDTFPLLRSIKSGKLNVDVPEIESAMVVLLKNLMMDVDIPYRIIRSIYTESDGFNDFEHTFLTESDGITVVKDKLNYSDVDTIIPVEESQIRKLPILIIDDHLCINLMGVRLWVMSMELYNNPRFEPTDKDDVNIVTTPSLLLWCHIIRSIMETIQFMHFDHERDMVDGKRRFSYCDMLTKGPHLKVLIREIYGTCLRQIDDTIVEPHVWDTVGRQFFTPDTHPEVTWSYTDVKVYLDKLFYDRNPISRYLFEIWCLIQLNILPSTHHRHFKSFNAYYVDTLVENIYYDAMSFRPYVGIFPDMGRVRDRLKAARDNMYSESTYRNVSVLVGSRVTPGVNRPADVTEHLCRFLYHMFFNTMSNAEQSGRHVIETLYPRYTDHKEIGRWFELLETKSMKGIEA